MTNTSRRGALALSSDCADRTLSSSLDRIVTRTSQVVIGEFRCPVDHPSFTDSGPIEHFVVVFPRTSVWIQHEGAAPFFSDPTITTIYNRGQRYERRPHSGAGDRADWFGVCADLAREITSFFDARAGDSPRPFAFQHAPSHAALYYRQRTLLTRVRRGDIDTLETEEEVIDIVESVLAAAYRLQQRMPNRVPKVKKRIDIVDAARSMLVDRVREQVSLRDVAARIDVSPYHLCRLFHAATGVTMSNYRNQLRVRMSLEMLDSSVAPRRSISEIAHALGFSSHSHYVSAMRRAFGTTPSTVRRLAAGGS